MTHDAPVPRLQLWDQTLRNCGLALPLVLSGCYSGAQRDTSVDDDGMAEGSEADDQGTDTADDGDGDDAADGAPIDPVCEELQAGPAPIRRLTRTEYNRTLLDLLGDDSAPADEFLGEDIVHGFDNAAQGANINRLLTEQFETAAGAIATRAVEDLVGLLGCDPVSDEDACIDSFVNDFGLRTYRRPLSDAEHAQLREFYDGHRTDTDPTNAVRLLVAAMLQSPFFLYRVETGEPTNEQTGVMPLSDYDVATRLSYLLWNTMPDDTLFAAAAAGELSTGDQVAAQTERMLAHPKAESVLTDFHEQWLALRGNVPTAIEDAAPLLREEVQTFIIAVLRDGDGKLETLLRADFSFMNRELAEFYGRDPGSLGDEFERVTLDPSQRSGLLTSGLLLALQAEEHESSPIKRGHLVRERILCQPLPPPPPDLMIELPEPDPTQTTRERYAQHREDVACSGCHDRIDPIGFGFEHYDQNGLWRDLENGLPVDASGDLQDVTPKELTGVFDGAVQLAERLAASETFQRCATDNWFRYAYGREQTIEDQCTVDFLKAAFAQSEGSVAALLRALTRSDAFRFRPAHGGQ